jgi:hypothetical protein
VINQGLESVTRRWKSAPEGRSSRAHGPPLPLQFLEKVDEFCHGAAIIRNRRNDDECGIKHPARASVAVDRLPVPARPLGEQKRKKPQKRLFCLPRKNLGRRDWTRTNDPHHVKVVL